MKAVILAAGRGSRLIPITNYTHKTLLEVAEHSILEWQIRNYCSQGVDEIYVVTGYRHKEVAAQVEQLDEDLQSTTSVETVKSNRWDKTDNLVSLYLTENFVRGEPFVLSNGDAFADSAIFEILCQNPETAIAPYDSNEFEPEELKLELRDGQPREILDKGKQNGAGSTIGMFAFNSVASEALFADIESHIDIESEKTQWFEASVDRIFSEVKFDAVDVCEQEWVEIDTREDLEMAWEKWNDDPSNVDHYLETIIDTETTESQQSD